MKKVLSLVLALSLVLGSFSLSFANTTDAATEAALFLEGQALLVGSGDGLDLESDLTREQLMLIIARFKGESETALAYDSASEFADADKATWKWDNVVAWAKANGITNGYPDNTFGFGKKVTAQELQAFMLNVIGPAVAWNEVPAKAEEAGLNIDLANLTGDVTYGDLAIMMVNTLDANDHALAIELSLETPRMAAAVAEELKIVSFAQAGVKKLAVTFNKAAEGTTLVVKRGKVTVGIKEITWNEDKTVATIETTTTLLADDYTVTAGELTATVEAETQKVATIELTSDQAIETTMGAATATIGYKVYNQFGEDITKNALASSLTWTLAPNATAVDNNAGKLTITNTLGANKWTAGESNVVITAVDSTTGTVTNNTVLINAASKLQSIELVEVKNVDADAVDQVFNQGDTGSKYDWEVAYKAIDQYGKEITNYTYLNANVTLNNNITSGTTVAWDTDADGNAVIQVTPDGTATLKETVVITAVDKTSGANDTFSFVIDKDASLKTFSMSLPEAMIIANETIVFPFEAYDQYGEAVADVAALTAGVNFNGAPFTFVEDPITGDITLEYKVTTDGTKVVTTIVGTDVQTMTFTVEEEAIPTIVSAIDADTVTNMTYHAATALDADSFIVKDQYDREIDLGTYSTDVYTIEVTEDDNTVTKVAQTGSTIAAASGSVTLTGTASAGEKAFTATIQKNGVDVASSEFGFKASTIAKSDIVEYKLTDIEKLYTNGSLPAYKADVEVIGYTAAGEKVALDWATDIQAVNTVGNITYTPGTKTVVGTTLTTAGETETATVLVAVNADKGVVTLRDDITLTDEAAKAVAIITKKATGVTLTGEGKFADNVLAIEAAELAGWDGTAMTGTDIFFQVEDQYGVKGQVTPNFYYISEDDVATTGTYSINNTTGALTSAGAVDGDEFTVTAVTKNGLSVSLKVIVK